MMDIYRRRPVTVLCLSTLYDMYVHLEARREKERNERFLRFDSKNIQHRIIFR